MEARTIQNTGEEFLTWLQVERRFAPGSIVSYRSRLKCFIRDVGDIPLGEFTMEHIFELKQILYSRNNSEVFIGVCLACIKGLLKYYSEHYSAPLQINLDLITFPKRPRRDVIFLTSEEIKRFRDSINTKPLAGLRFRTLVEVLLGSGMRISEALSLNRNSIDYTNREARIIGKGNKERVVYFTDDAMSWIGQYISRRKDTHEAIFVTSYAVKYNTVRRLRNQDLTRYFKNARNKAKLNKHITPHSLRHCFATNLAMNSCPFTEIKSLLGHERLDTTIRYYVGITDQKRAKEAHSQYLRY